jgi:arylsulfatase A-like enzyme
MKHSIFFSRLICFLGIFSLIFLAGNAQLLADKPNIIFILADDLGYGDLGCYGQEKIKTPHLDRFASEGIRFTDAYAGNTVCGPSRCSFLTGKHPGHASIRGNGGGTIKRYLDPKELSVTKFLKEQGYHTSIIGKWGFLEQGEDGQPAVHGFDESFVYGTHIDAHDYLPKFLWRNGEKVPVNEGTYSHDAFTEEALHFLGKKHAKPFFLFLSFTIPHMKLYQVPTTEPYTDTSWPLPEKQFAAMIHRLDVSVGQVMDKLKESNLEANTLVVFTSDNGPHNKEHRPAFTKSAGPLRGIKRDIYEGGIRVPFMVRWPGKVPSGKVSDEILANWDLFPTFAEFAGGETPKGLSGISMKKAFLGEEGQEKHAYLYWEYYDRKAFEQAARRGNWKAVTSGKNTPIQLFDLSKDIGEERNVAADHPEIIKEMEQILKEAHRPHPAWPIPEGTLEEQRNKRAL